MFLVSFWVSAANAMQVLACNASSDQKYVGVGMDTYVVLSNIILEVFFVAGGFDEGTPPRAQGRIIALVHAHPVFKLEVGVHGEDEPVKEAKNNNQ